MAVMVSVQGYDWYRIEDRGEVERMLDAAGWAERDTSGLMTTWSKEGQPDVRITQLDPIESLGTATAAGLRNMTPLERSRLMAR